MEELLSLKWNNHETTFFKMLSQLRKNERYTDATLSCEGKFYPAHKLVLATCSEYFNEVFDNTSCKCPVIILKDMKAMHIELLLDYMYMGEVDVGKSELGSLLQTAESLQIKGLAIPEEEKSLRGFQRDFLRQILNDKAAEGEGGVPLKCGAADARSVRSKSVDLNDKSYVSSPPRDSRRDSSSEPKIVASKQDASSDSSDASYSEDDLLKEETTTKKRPKSHTITQNEDTNANQMIETKSKKRKRCVNDSEKTYTCLTCSRSFAKKYNLTRHQLSHEGKKFHCKLCDNRFTRSDVLKAHINKQHPS